MYSDSSSGDLRRLSTLTVSSQNSHLDLYSPQVFHGSGIGLGSETRATTRQPIPYVTHNSDSGFGSTLSSGGSSCSYLPPPPPYRMRQRQPRIHRSLSDSKYSLQQPEPMRQSILNTFRWNSGVSLSPSPSMSTVSCPEYPELQDKLHRLIMARDSLALQVSVLTEEVGAQKEKIRDLESLLAVKRNKLTSTEELLQDKYHSQEGIDLESKKSDLIAEVSNLKLKFAMLEREKDETERKLRLSQSEMDHVNQSMQGMIVQKQLHNQNGYTPISRPQRPERQNDEMEQLRLTVQRLVADNEAKNIQINSLKGALHEQMNRRYPPEDSYHNRWNEQVFDVNTQIRRLLYEEPVEAMTHSTSFPVSLCSSVGPRSCVQPSSSYTSSLSTASPQSWSEANKHHLHPSNSSIRNEGSYKSPASPAARQLAAELDELRRLSDLQHGQHPSYSSASLPRSVSNKTASTLTLPAKKLSLSSGPSAVESDDEIARGRITTTASQASSRSGGAPLRRDRTRSSLRNLFSKLTRSTSQDQGAFRRGSAVRSTSSARLGSTGTLSGTVCARPSANQFMEWNSEQLAEWMTEVGYPGYVPEVVKHIRNGRVLLSFNPHDIENILGVKNPIHKKRLFVLLRNIESGHASPQCKWDVQQSLRWLEEIGLPQYKETFLEYVVDGALLMALNAGDMLEMRITNCHHYLAISRSLQHLKNSGFKNAIDKRFDPSTTNSCPCADRVVRWSHAATCEWLRTIDLAEFTPNLLCAGVPGALMVYEPSFTAESLAEILQIPSHKTLLRRHLTSHFNQLLGQKIISEKRSFLGSSAYPQLSPSIRIRVVKRGFSLTRKKSRNEICLEPDEPLCPLDTAPISENGDTTSLESSNV